MLNSEHPEQITEQIEKRLTSILTNIAECNRIIEAAESARQRREKLRQELARELNMAVTKYAEAVDPRYGVG